MKIIIVDIVLDEDHGLTGIVFGQLFDCHTGSLGNPSSVPEKGFENYQAVVGGGGCRADEVLCGSVGGQADR